MNTIKFASSETTIQELKCYNFDQDVLTETTNDFNFSNAEVITPYIYGSEVVQVLTTPWRYL